MAIVARMKLRMRMRAASLLAVALSFGSIAALLAELLGIATMRSVLLGFTLPTTILLVVLATAKVSGLEGLRDRIRVGAVGGVLGVVGYDLIRIPFALLGMRVFAPIYSYGMVGAGAEQSTGLTNVLGWSYHLSNGITFGIAFAVIFARRSRWIAVVYGVALEAVAFLSPFTDQYGLTGKWWPITVAFLAHVAYGWPLGVVVERFDTVRSALGRTRFSVSLAVLAPFFLVVLMFRPWTVSDELQRAYDLADANGVPTAVVDGDEWRPEWLRIPAGGCIDVVNDTGTTFTSPLGDVTAGATTRFCIDEPGVQRVKLDNAPYSGGFVYVED